MHQVSRFFCDCDCDFLTQVKNRSDSLGPKSASPPPPAERVAIFSCDEKSQAIASLFAMFEEKSVPTAVWLATGRFATENRDDLRLRFVVLSGII